jgi:O-methyltransferase involved in polyketide biosynthesis
MPMTKAEDSPPHEAHNSKVSPTAWGVAYLRTFTDIPYTKEIFEMLEARRIAAGISDYAGEMKKATLAPQLEARYKLVDRLIGSVGVNQILEVASGLAPRGLNLTSANPEIHFVDTDFPAMIDDKRDILQNLGITLPTNLTMRHVDALSQSDLAAAASSFSVHEPVVVVNEGLMRYLDFDKKTIYANNVRKLLEQFGGVWITPDISLRSAMGREDEIAPGHIHKLQNMTDVDLSKNVFESEDHAEDFFTGLGFAVERHSFLEVSDELVSPARLGMSAQQVERLNGPCPAFIMRLA